MEFSRIQVIALSVLTTIITDKYLISRPIVTPAPVTITPLPTSIVISQVPTPSNPSNSQNELILKELTNLRKDMTAAINNINQNQPSNSIPLPTFNPSLIGGMVKINSPQWKKLDVYETPSTSSKVVDTIIYDTIYFYRQKNSNWYQLELDTGVIGWVQSQFLKEFP